MDKRDLGPVFRDRLDLLMRRSGETRAAFARSVGLDRSALTQLLSGASTRLPRAETLRRIAERQAVSLDWLLGLSQDEMLGTEIRPLVEIAAAEGGKQDTLLERWHKEASGTKIRYVPAQIPDLLRTPEVIEYEASGGTSRASLELREAEFRLDYNRRPETDMEVCMPRQRLEVLAQGSGQWKNLDRDARAEQLAYMADLVEELYPTFRLFLYDQLQNFSIPYTVFGPKRAAIFMGEMYLVLNATEHIRSLTRHFDNLIRKAVVTAHESAGFIRSLPVD